MSRRVLIVDDDAPLRAAVAHMLEDWGEVHVAEDPVEGLDVLLREIPDVALVDVVMPHGGGARLASDALRYLPGCALVGMSGQARPEDFVALFRHGMDDYLLKPFTKEELVRALNRALRLRSLRERRSRESPEFEASGDDPIASLVGESPAWRAAMDSLRRAARVDAGVLVTGATGTGKDMAARALHAASSRRDGPFVAVACAALPASLAEVELFGHAAGAFTGATAARAGRFEEARGGTLLLDEVSALPEAVQAGLLRALDSGAIQRVGEGAERATDARLVATSSADPHELARQGRLRSDLAHRLDRIRVDLPPLSERGDDLLLLSAHVLERQARREQRRPKSLSPDAVRVLRSHSWPGNVRELANALERAGIMSGGSAVIDSRHVVLGRLASASLDPSDWPLPESGLDLPALLRDVEDDLVRQAMERADGHHGRAAALLRIGRSSLERKLARRREVVRRAAPEPGREDRLDNSAATHREQS